MKYHVWDYLQNNDLTQYCSECEQRFTIYQLLDDPEGEWTHCPGKNTFKQLVKEITKCD